MSQDGTDYYLTLALPEVKESGRAHGFAVDLENKLSSVKRQPDVPGGALGAVATEEVTGSLKHFIKNIFFVFQLVFLTLLFISCELPQVLVKGMLLFSGIGGK